MNYSDLLLRWSIGNQDTTSLSKISEDKFRNMLWLTKLSIASFQKWFSGSRYVLFYNGTEFDWFVDVFNEVEPKLEKDVEIVDQIKSINSGELQNPYHFFPSGVWWKWVPFRYDINFHEISVDTDILCINEPKSWYGWLDSSSHIIIAPERFSKILVNTCGDFYKHPVLREKKPLNCGIVGLVKGYNSSESFYRVTEKIEYGQTRDSLFITEQGAINVWAYLEQMNGKDLYVLDFEKNAWVRDFVYFQEKGVEVETIHATAWHKNIALGLRPILERKIFDESYDSSSFLSDILKSSLYLDEFSKYVVRRQLGFGRNKTEYFFD